MTDETEIDYDDPKFNQGVLHVVHMLARVVKASDEWNHADGSESYDDDLGQTLINILGAAGMYDENTGRFASLRPAVRLVHGELTGTSEGK
jgi:hypothetical protein